jgi:hypothetical protein
MLSKKKQITSRCPSGWQRWQAPGRPPAAGGGPLVVGHGTVTTSGTARVLSSRARELGSCEILKALARTSVDGKRDGCAHGDARNNMRGLRADLLVPRHRRRKLRVRDCVRVAGNCHNFLPLTPTLEGLHLRKPRASSGPSSSMYYT